MSPTASDVDVPSSRQRGSSRSIAMSLRSGRAAMLMDLTGLLGTASTTAPSNIPLGTLCDEERFQPAQPSFKLKGREQFSSASTERPVVEDARTVGEQRFDVASGAMAPRPDRLTGPPVPPARESPPLANQ